MRSKGFFPPSIPPTRGGKLISRATRFEAAVEEIELWTETPTACPVHTGYAGYPGATATFVPPPSLRDTSAGGGHKKGRFIRKWEQRGGSSGVKSLFLTFDQSVLSLHQGNQGVHPKVFHYLKVIRSCPGVWLRRILAGTLWRHAQQRFFPSLNLSQKGREINQSRNAF